MWSAAFCGCFAGVPGLEPRLTEPESVGLPITPYPIDGQARIANPAALYSTGPGEPDQTRELVAAVCTKPPAAQKQVSRLRGLQPGQGPVPPEQLHRFEQWRRDRRA